jgi:tRNA(Ile)-lysidine synthase
MALLHLCLELHIKVTVAHCNFQLRGDESMRDEQFVLDTCQQLSLPCYVQRFNTATYANEQGLGIQEAARNLRYAYFHELQMQHQFDAVLTAHHALDNIETVLMNLMRGCAITGIAGIPKQRDFYHRPLLYISKQCINEYIHQQQINYVEDSSNQSDDYTRNYIRHHVIPALQETDAHALENFAASIQRVSLENNLLQEFVESWKQQHMQVVDDGFIIQLKDLSASEHPSFILKHILKNENVSSQELQKLIQAETGSILETEHFRLLKNREEIIAKEKSKKQLEDDLFIDENSTKVSGFECRKYDRTEDTLIDRNRYVAMLDFEKLSFPLQVRSWKHGDSFYPLGMKNKKLVSDFLINEKVSMFDKEKVKVITSKDEIIWVAGYRIDDRFCIRESTQQIFEMRRI